MNRVSVTIVFALLVSSCQQMTAPAHSSFNEKRLCAEAGWASYEREKQQYEVGLVLPVFAYNAELDTCFCMTGVNAPNATSGGPPTLQRWIIDVPTNRRVAEFTAEAPSEEFKREFKRLMGYEYVELSLDAAVFRSHAAPSP